MDGMSPGPALVGNYVLFLAVRQLLVYMAWILAAALAGAAACWCCGYGAQAAWSKAESSRRAWQAARRGEEPIDDEVADEVDRGITEIETFLAAQTIVLPARSGWRRDWRSARRRTNRARRSHRLEFPLVCLEPNLTRSRTDRSRTDRSRT